MLTKFIGDYLLTFLGFGLLTYLLLPRLNKKPLSPEKRLNKAVWAAFLFTSARIVLDLLFP
ncbi:MAG: hypothetical protein N2491_07240 [Negativicutes bacterium]|nr:hypothetical protein [Negativicutes bacterium]